MPKPISARANLRAELRGGASLLATFVLIPRIEIVELVAASGFDAVILDLEHGTTDIGELPALVAAAQGAGLSAMVRVSENSAIEVGKVLDAGADGILVPHVSSAREAQKLVAGGRYPPEGNRSLNPYTRGNAYGYAVDPYRGANKRVALIAMLEGVDAISNLESIAEVDGIDAVFVGPMDLSAALGLPGEPEHPLVVDAIKDVFARARATGCGVGTYAPTPQVAARWRLAGAAVVALSADIAMAAVGFSQTYADCSRRAQPKAR